MDDMQIHLRIILTVMVALWVGSMFLDLGPVETPVLIIYMVAVFLTFILAIMNLAKHDDMLIPLIAVVLSSLNILMFVIGIILAIVEPGVI